MEIASPIKCNENLRCFVDFCWFFMGWRVSGGTWMVTLDGLGYMFAGWEVSGGAWAAEQLPGGTPDPGTLPRRWKNENLWAVLQAPTITAGCSSTMLQATRLQAMRLPGLQRIRDYETSRLYRITCCQFDLPFLLSLVAPKGAGGYI